MSCWTPSSCAARSTRSRPALPTTTMQAWTCRCCSQYSRKKLRSTPSSTPRSPMPPEGPRPRPPEAVPLPLWHGRMTWALFLAALLGALGLHIGTNVINEIYDVRHGIDAITSPRMSMAILKGRISERDAFVVAWSGFVLALVMGIFLLLQRGWPIVVLGLIGFIGGYFYTAAPFQYKYRALGLPLVFTLMGTV